MLKKALIIATVSLAVAAAGQQAYARTLTNPGDPVAAQGKPAKAAVKQQKPAKAATTQRKPVNKPQVLAAPQPSPQALGKLAPSAAPLYLERPLVVIRFNQRNVYYQRPLYSAVVRALQVKPTVTFEIVSMIPVTGDKTMDEKIATTSMTNVRRVFRDMVDMGIPDSRLQVLSEAKQGLETNEVHVFVR